MIRGRQLEVIILSTFYLPIPGGYDEEFYNQLISILCEHGEHLSNEEE